MSPQVKGILSLLLSEVGRDLDLGTTALCGHDGWREREGGGPGPISGPPLRSSVRSFVQPIYGEIRYNGMATATLATANGQTSTIQSNVGWM